MKSFAILLLGGLAASSCVDAAAHLLVSELRGQDERADKTMGAPVSDLMPWYKTGDQITEILHSLATSCSGADAEFTTKMGADGLEMGVFKVSRSSANPKTKAMLVFGEHARELISPESAVNFAQNLCGQGSQSSHAAKVLDDVEFILVPNANPIARKQVEAGSYCKRTNEHGVDLNRNWGDKNRDESMAGSGDETDPGPRGFSEPETEILKGLVDEIRPDIYLSIHAGAYLLGEPWGFTETKTPENVAAMSEVLGPISQKYCDGQCPYGGLAKMIHYANGGCDIDYVYEKTGSPYVFTWEIYTGERYRQEYIDTAREMNGKKGAQLAQTQEPESLTDLLRRMEAEEKGKSFLQTRTKTKQRLGSELREPEKDEEAQDCIDQFLPKTQSETQRVVENWSAAYLELCDEVVKKRKAE